MGLAVPALAGLKIEFEIGIGGRDGGDVGGDRRREGRPAEIGVDDHPSRVDHAAERSRAHQGGGLGDAFVNGVEGPIERGGIVDQGEVSQFGHDLLKHSVHHGAPTRFNRPLHRLAAQKPRHLRDEAAEIFGRRHGLGHRS